MPEKEYLAFVIFIYYFIKSMMKVPILFLFVLCIFMECKAQMDLNVNFHFKGAKDTLHYNAIVDIIGGIFSSENVNPATFHNYFWVGTRGAEKEVEEKKLDYLNFIDFQKQNRTFVNVPAIDKKNKTLFEVIVHGKISWYCQYRPASMSMGGYSVINYFIKDSLPPVNNKFFKTISNILKPLMLDNLSLASRLDKAKKTETIKQIIEEYNKDY